MGTIIRLQGCGTFIRGIAAGAHAWTHVAPRMMGARSYDASPPSVISSALQNQARPPPRPPTEPTCHWRRADRSLQSLTDLQLRRCSGPNLGRRASLAGNPMPSRVSASSGPHVDMRGRITIHAVKDFFAQNMLTTPRARSEWLASCDSERDHLFAAPGAWYFPSL